MAKPVYTLSQIIGRLDSGQSWTTSHVSYATPASAFGTDVERNGFVDMTTFMQIVAADSFELWDDLIAIALDPVSSGGDINMGYSTTTGGSTYTVPITSGFLNGREVLTDAEIWLDSSWDSHDADDDFYFGSYGVMTYIHEIGHALGLDHPGNYNGTATYAADAVYAQDTNRYSVMSYFDADADGSATSHWTSYGEWLYPETPMVHDIAAIQSIYGADMTTRAGNTVYGFGSTAGKGVYNFAHNPDPILTIWDGGGTDKLNLSGFSDKQTIRLSAGSYSSVGGMTNNLDIAFGCLIENATGGKGSDTIIGNAAANKLMGMAGKDTLKGAAGNDHLWGGSGADILSGGAGTDRAYFSEQHSHYTIKHISGGYLVTDKSSGEIDKLIGIEKIVFTDSTLIL
ncbi:MAG: M10 family metallopeptidase C-terminal domain-containing protein [Hyphomicrobiaceae bacterium]